MESFSSVLSFDFEYKKLIKLHSKDFAPGWVVIENIDELEIAGVLACAGHLESLENLKISHLDVTNIPVNIVNSLIKIVKVEIQFFRVTGFCISMIESINCEKLRVVNVKLQGKVNEENEIKIRGNLTLGKGHFRKEITL